MANQAKVSGTEGDAPATKDTLARFEALLSDDSEEQEIREAAPDGEAADEPDLETPDGSEHGDEEQTDESDEIPDPNSVQLQLHRVKVNGEEVEVPYDELVKGYSRTADYTRKTTEVAERRKALEQEDVALRGERAKYAEYLTQLEQAIKDATPQEPDWATVETEHPDEFPALWARWQQHKEKMSRIATAREQAQTKVLEDQTAAYGKYLEGERERLLEVIPEWKDAKVQKKEKAEIVAYAAAHGFTKEEIATVADHRPIALMRKAMLWDKAQKAKPDVQKRIEKIKSAKPGSGDQRKPNSVEAKAKEARSRLAKTGRPEDADAVFESML